MGGTRLGAVELVDTGAPTRHDVPGMLVVLTLQAIVPSQTTASPERLVRQRPRTRR
jgi:hypothetical protein